MKEDEELEFATKDDLEAIKADPRLNKYYQAVQAGVTKKFQGWSDEKKKLQQTVETLQSQVSELDGGLREWEDWFTQNKPILEKVAKMSDQSNLDDQRGKRGKMKDEDADDRYEKLIQTINQAGQQIEQRFGHLQKVLNLSMQLNDLYRRNPKMDGNKVLDVALKKGYLDLEKAYADDDAYGQEILEGKVQEKLGPRLEEEIAKRRTNVETGSGAIPTKFELPKEMPKSFTDAGQQFLEERAKEENKPPKI
jgi:hypothetical protein